jgi:ribose transport system permease protein
MTVDANDSVSDTARGEEAAPRRRWTVAPARQAERYALPVFLVLLIVVFAIWIPTFRTVPNIQTMVNVQALIIFLAITATISLRAGVIDFSIASVMGLCGAIAARLGQDGVALGVILLAVLGAALAIGLIQGVLVVLVGVDSFVLTLGSLTALSGLTYLITGSSVLTHVPPKLVSFARVDIFGLPLTTWLGWLAVAAAYYVFEWTPLGRYLLFVGGNPHAARLAGVRVDRIRFGIFVSNAVLAGVIGLLLVGQFGVIDPTIANEYLLPPFAAAFLGATAITPGRFNAVGTMFAAYLLIVGITGLQLLGAQIWASNFFNGAALVAAVTFARLVRRKGTL